MSVRSSATTTKGKLPPDGMENLIRYAYSDALRIGSVEEAMMSAYTAKKYALPHLVQQCLTYLESNVEPKNVCSVYEFAKSMDAPTLIFVCLNIIDRESEEVLSATNFVRALPGTAKLISCRSYMTVKSEFSVYTALVEWAEQECRRRRMDPDDPEDVRRVLGGTLRNVRFLAMSPAEFAKGPAKSGVLTVRECFSIFMNLAVPRCEPLVPGLCANYNRRTAPPDYFVSSRYKWLLSYGPAGRRLREFGIRFSVANRNVFLLGISLPVRLNSTSQPLPKYCGLLVILRITEDGEIERQDHEVCFSVAKGSDTAIRFKKPYYVRPGERYEIGLLCRPAIKETANIPSLRTAKREDNAEGVTFQFAPFTYEQPTAADVMEFSELHFYC